MCILDEVGQGRVENLFMELLYAPQVALMGTIVYIVREKYGRNVNSKGKQYHP